MLVPRRRIVAVLAAGLLAAPASALGQSAGDDQYQDPFAGEGQQQPQGDSDEGGGEAPAAPQAADATPTESAPGTAAAAPQSAAELPRTGAETGAAILLAGSILLAGGIVVRVRLRERS